MRQSLLQPLLLVAALSIPASAQGVPIEVAELRRRVVAIRADLANITAAADYATDIFTRDPTARFLFSASRNPGLSSEFGWHAGASPEMGDADDPATHGVVIYPVAAWQSSTLGVAALLDRWRAAGRPVIVIGPSADRPAIGTLRWLITNGAPDGGQVHAGLNGLANMVATWTLYVEFVASATRHHWQPGLYLSHLAPNADEINSHVRFRTAGGDSVTPIAAGELGREYLDRVDSLLTLASRPQHQIVVQRAADSLRAVRAGGHALFVGACAYYLQGYLPTDTLSSPFHPWNGREGISGFANTVARGGDGVLWFGYSGYDCPHVQMAQPLQDNGARVVVVADNLAAGLPPNVIASVALDWKLPERIARVPFDPEGAGSVASVDAMLHYLWIRRLVAVP